MSRECRSVWAKLGQAASQISWNELGALLRTADIPQKPAPSPTVAKNGSSARARPKASIAIIRFDRPPRAAILLRERQPEQAEFGICAHSARLQPSGLWRSSFVLDA